MNITATLSPEHTREHPMASALDASTDVLKIAIVAVGGQGGGVLSNWIAELANRGGYAAQMTSVAGVAQRTGATIYYLEMAPIADRRPVFALTPTPGDVDIVIAAELMEAGRAVVRQFVTVDRTTLIASTHRVLAVNEKQIPGDGRAPGSMVLNEIKAAAFKTVTFDMQRLADDAGTMISASLFGALAKSGATPFSAKLFEEVVRESGRGVDQSLAAFNAALNYVDTEKGSDTGVDTKAAVRVNTDELILPKAVGPSKLQDRWQSLVTRVSDFPSTTQTMVLAGLRKVVDYQDIDYGDEYLQRLQPYQQLANKDAVAGTDEDNRLVLQAAKYIANAMCYDDILRVADLKTRSSRQTRLFAEQQANHEQIVHVTEYFHPRAEEFCGTLPSGIGAWIENRPSIFQWLDRRLNKGRRIRTDGLTGFGMLWLVSRLRPYRRKLLRHRYETAHVDSLTTLSLEQAAVSHDIACEVLQCQRLIKGYADTHSRGQSKFHRVTAVLNNIGSDDSMNVTAHLRRLREAALEDEAGDELDRLLGRDGS